MRGARPGKLAVRAVNQYRNREVISYLGLRYYLDNSAAQNDEWAREVATQLTLDRTSPTLFRVNHFKDKDNRRVIHHRPIYLPGPNESLAEAVLLEECAKHPQVFENPTCLYSYHLSSGTDRSGMFAHYMTGLKSRHQAIAEACVDCPNGEVHYLDIKSFYPSLDLEIVERAWNRAADRAGMRNRYRDLGLAMISMQASQAENTGDNLLVGPMFSHLLANLALRELDVGISPSLASNYFRYVDDITLVGSKASILESKQVISGLLEDLGLELHDDASPKHIQVSTKKWLEGRYDFSQGEESVSWMTLIGDLKRFLLKHPDQQPGLEDAFQSEGFRIPVKDYSEAAYERGFLENVVDYAKRSWFRAQVREVTIQTLLSGAKELRSRYARSFAALLQLSDTASGYGRKRIVPKMRYFGGRLIYLLPEEGLAELALQANEMPELLLTASVMDAVSSGRLDDVVSLGTNAAQAAAQPLRASGRKCSLESIGDDACSQQSLAVAELNGLKLSTEEPIPSNEIVRFARKGADRELFRSKDGFMRELACLHGLHHGPRHAKMLTTAFDEDEEFTFDAIDQLQSSDSP